MKNLARKLNITRNVILAPRFKFIEEAKDQNNFRTFFGPIFLVQLAKSSASRAAKQCDKIPVNARN